jgi:hypothetical protein
VSKPLPSHAEQYHYRGGRPGKPIHVVLFGDGGIAYRLIIFRSRLSTLLRIQIPPSGTEALYRWSILY